VICFPHVVVLNITYFLRLLNVVAVVEQNALDSWVHSWGLMMTWRVTLWKMKYMTYQIKHENIMLYLEQM